jgi:hypothetical protein
LDFDGFFRMTRCIGVSETNAIRIALQSQFNERKKRSRLGVRVSLYFHRRCSEGNGRLSFIRHFGRAYRRARMATFHGRSFCIGSALSKTMTTGGMIDKRERRAEEGKKDTPPPTTGRSPPADCSPMANSTRARVPHHAMDGNHLSRSTRSDFLRMADQHNST